jgi:penicillin-binding protein 2
MLGGHRFNDDLVGGHGSVDMRKSIIVSCNTYYYALGHDMGIDAIHDFMQPFGFGQKTGIDLENEKSGACLRRNGSATASKVRQDAGSVVILSRSAMVPASTPTPLADRARCGQSGQ